MKSACSLIALLVVTAAGAFAQTGAPPRQGTPKSNKAAAIEQALIEHACRSQLPGVAGEEAYQECLSTRLRSLRADFGRDLARVSAAQRKAVDSACSAARAAEGCGAYLECLTLQLVSIRDRRSKANPSAPQEPVDLSPPESAQLPSLAVPVGETSSWLSPLWIGVTLVALVAVCGGALLAVKGRAATRRCRVCGADAPEAGDLCPTCRHETAEALRQAAAERAGRERAQVEEQHRQSEREEELRRRRAHEEEEARLRYQEEERQREENARRREKEAGESRQRSRATAPDAEDVFDPHAILGVPRDASKEAIDAACQDARLKYAPDQASHLEPELQEHYRRKAEAVERAYRTLTE